MKHPHRITFTVTNDLNFDQRMIRICTSLQNEGYQVTLIGRAHKASKPLTEKIFRQKRLKLNSVSQGKLMYILFWIKLFFYLLFHRTDLICAIDLDTILPVYLVSKLKGVKRVYDAHEIFSEMKEVVTRPTVKRMWDTIERFAVPKFPDGYTIGECYAEEFHRRYGVNYEIVRNATVLKPLARKKPEMDFILYQGAVNEGRCFESLIPAMKYVEAPLIICGNGNFFEQAQTLVKENDLERKISFTGYLTPAELKKYTEQAKVGITLFDALGLSNKLSMANRFFDYMHNGVPQLAMDYPEYRRVNKQFQIAYLVKETSPEIIAEGLNQLFFNEEYHQFLSHQSLKAREVYCWQMEEKKLLTFYERIFRG